MPCHCFHCSNRCNLIGFGYFNVAFISILIISWFIDVINIHKCDVFKFLTKCDSCRLHWKQANSVLPWTYFVKGVHLVISILLMIINVTCFTWSLLMQTKILTHMVKLCRYILHLCKYFIGDNKFSYWRYYAASFLFTSHRYHEWCDVLWCVLLWHAKTVSLSVLQGHSPLCPSHLYTTLRKKYSFSEMSSFFISSQINFAIEFPAFKYNCFLYRRLLNSWLVRKLLPLLRMLMEFCRFI